jgi:hypothetical protein
MEFDGQIACHEPIYSSNMVQNFMQPSTFFLTTGKTDLEWILIFVNFFRV